MIEVVFICIAYLMPIAALQLSKTGNQEDKFVSLLGPEQQIQLIITERSSTVASSV